MGYFTIKQQKTWAVMAELGYQGIYGSGGWGVFAAQSANKVLSRLGRSMVRKIAKDWRARAGGGPY